MTNPRNRGVVRLDSGEILGPPESYLPQIGPWTLRGALLEEMVRAQAARWSDDGDDALDSAARGLLRVLDEGWDPR